MRAPLVGRKRYGGDGDPHLPGRGLDLDFVWRDELRLELAAPLDSGFYALARIVELPLGSAQVARDGIWLVKPASLP